MKRARHAPAPPILQVLPSVQAERRTTEQAPLVRFERVSFGYETKPNVLQDINFEIHRGDVIAILGANGAGKTTLVKHAIGLLKPTSGKVLINGVDTPSQCSRDCPDIGLRLSKPQPHVVCPNRV